MRHNRFLDSLTQLIVQGIVTQESSPCPTLPTASSTNELAAILSNFPDITEPHYGNHFIKHDITHHITTTGPKSVHIHDSFLQNSSRFFARNSNICYKKVSSSHALVVGHHHYTWYPKQYTIVLSLNYAYHLAKLKYI